MSNSCNLMNCILPVSSVHGIFQARTLEWVAISFSRGSSWSRDRTRVSCIAGRFLTTEPLEKPTEPLEKLFVGSRSEEEQRVLMWPREGLLQPPITSAPVGKRQSFLKPHPFRTSLRSRCLWLAVKWKTVVLTKEISVDRLLGNLNRCVFLTFRFFL